MKNILVADSCAGGMCVVREIMDCTTNFRLMYLADGERNPFGLRNRAQIQETVEEWLRYFAGPDMQLDALVIACNTAAAAVEPIRRELSLKWQTPFTTMFDGLIMCIEENAPVINGHAISLFGTQFTIESGEYERALLEGGASEVYHIVGTKTERLVAYGLWDNAFEVEAARNEILGQLDPNAEIVVLGCTCFSIIKPMLRNIFGHHAIFLDPSEYVAQTLISSARMPETKATSQSQLRVYASGDLHVWSPEINIIAEKLLGRRFEVERIMLR